ncbi:MAG: nucleotidyltransferase domain-containing protein [Candidatus Aminicenantes bacterium]|nr:nucleotidyltransferase domain-containing protein [Candidatus Aminicenantes bacterium]
MSEAFREFLIRFIGDECCEGIKLTETILTNRDKYIQLVYKRILKVYIREMVDIKALISSKIRIEVLRILSVHPQDVHNINELSRLTGFSPRGVEKELKNLLSGGILKKEIVGNQHRYQMDPRCPIYTEIRSIITKTVGIADVIREALASHEKEIVSAFIYGSFASGEYNNDSDIDLFVVSDMSGIDLTKLTTPIQEKTGRTVNIAHFAPDEFEKRKSQKDHFVARVLEGPKIEITQGRDIHD